MIDIPVPMISGMSDSEKISGIISYLSQLSSALERELTSIDFSNLTETLANRINSSLTEHQDLSAYATKTFVKDHVQSVLESYSTTEEMENYVVNEILGVKSYTDNEISKLREELQTYVDEKISELE